MTARLSPFLRRVLLTDAAISGAAGGLMILGANVVDRLLGLPPTLLFWAGISLLPFAATLVFLATREAVSRTAVWAIIGVNALWVADSILLLLTGWVAPTGLGVAFIIMQAVAVALFAELQYMGLRRSTTAAT